MTWIAERAAEGRHVHHLRFVIQFFVDLFSQYSILDDEISANLRLRYAFNEGTDLYVVFNECTRTELPVDGTELPRSTGRSLLVKYNHTFSL